MALHTKTSQRYPIYMLLPQITPLRSTASHFRVRGHFEKSALNDPKMTLNTKKVNGPKMALNTKRSKVHIHIKITLEAQISGCLPLRPAAFELLAILRQMHQMTQTDR